MVSKERVKTALKHRTPDRIPVDFGGTAVTGIHILPISKLQEYLGLDKKPVKVIEPYQMLGEMDDELREILGIDTIGIIPKNNMFGIPNENWKEFRMPWGQDVLIPENFNTTIDHDGGILIYPEGDTSLAACAKMPRASYFFDAIIRQEPIDDTRLNPEDNLEEFSYITEEDLQHWKSEIAKYKNSKKALIATFGGTAFGDIALVPAMQLKHPKGIRDISEWYMSTMTRNDYVHAVFERQCEIGLDNLKKLFEVVGNEIEAVFICGTDFGTQASQFCSQDTFDQLYAPYYKIINNWIHNHTTWKSLKHSCGAIDPFMSHIIDSGFDIINPVQINAAGMEPHHLKEEYGKDIVFWGGGVDTQRVLPFAKPDVVEDQVLQLCEIFSKNGGFVFTTVHNIQANVPINNIIAMFNAIKKFNGQAPIIA
jgi:uroporphyrinogen-III decarboxylase